MQYVQTFEVEATLATLKAPLRDVKVYHKKQLLVILGAFAKPRKAATNSVMPVRPHGTTRIPMDGFS